MPISPSLAGTLSRVLRPNRPDRHYAYADAGHGYDRFGMHPAFVDLGDAIVSPFYEKYFRVLSYGAEHIPQAGPAILAANHSGNLPIDGMMLFADVVRHTDPVRVPRPVADYFVTALPFVSTLFARAGVVGGTRGNVRALLENGEMLMIFPEGVPGIIKPFAERYQLQDWRPGHCELAIRHAAPVVPVAIVGAEEQLPQLTRIPLPDGMPLPFLPIPATPIPLPTRFHIYYGEPLRFDQEFKPSDADNPEIVREAARRVKVKVQEMLTAGVKARKGIFA